MIHEKPVAFAYRKFVNDRNSTDGCNWIFEATGEQTGAAIRIPLYCNKEDLQLFEKHKGKNNG